MRCWRLAGADFAKSAFSGDGARIAGGRWNPKGTAMIYTASSLALAALELLVHTDDDLFPDSLVAFKVDIPDNVKRERIAIADLPPDWQAFPAPESLQTIGHAWVTKRASAILIVPSAVIPEENNVLLNPLHRDFARITWDKPRPFALDARLRR
jgi:RES domain-containing protein